jgi:hypothetical protein
VTHSRVVWIKGGSALKRLLVILMGVILALRVAAPMAFGKPEDKSHDLSAENTNSQANQNPGVISPKASKKYASLSAKWLQWAFSQPADVNPLAKETDTNAADCAQGQKGHVWFLGGFFAPVGVPTEGTVNRTCDVPTGTQLFFPIFNVECSTVEGNPPPGDSLTDCAKTLTDQGLNGGTLEASIDGVPVKNLSKYRVASGELTFDLPENNIDYFCSDGNGGFQQCPAGKSKAAEDGVYLLLAPLPPGEHTISFGGSFFPDGQGGFFFVEDINYTINVVKGKATK